MTNQVSYKFRDSARIKGGVDAQTVGETLTAIEGQHGGITPSLLVDKSRPEDAPLHPCFTWDNDQAAELYRETEARSIVRSVRVVYPDAKKSEPAFVHVRSDTEHPSNALSNSYYAPTREVVQKFSLYEYAWRDAQNRLSAAANALEDLERVAREHVCDQAVARVEATQAALAHVRGASDVLQSIND